jgi:hypothetical protein
MDVVGHDRETVELKLSLLAIVEERFEEELCVGFCLEVAVLQEGRDGYCVGVALRGHHGGEHTSGLKPCR